MDLVGHCGVQAEDVDQKNFATECQISPQWCKSDCGGTNDFQGKHILCKYCLGRSTGSGAVGTGAKVKYPKGSPAHPHGTAKKSAPRAGVSSGNRRR